MRLRAAIGAHEYKSGVVSIPLSQIVASPNQTRRSFPQAGIDELAASMERVGLLQPISVRCAGQKRYELIAGERRLRAARQLGWIYIDARVVDVDARDAALLTVIENLQREDLGYFEEAESYRMLIQTYGLTQEQIAYRLGKKQSTISNKLRLLRLSPPVRDFVTAAELTERHVRAMLRLEDDDAILQMARVCADNGWTVRRCEQEVALALAGRPVEKPRHGSVTALMRDNRIFVNAISETFREIRRSGVAAQMRQRDAEDGVVVEIFLPKL